MIVFGFSLCINSNSCVLDDISVHTTLEVQTVAWRIFTVIILNVTLYKVHRPINETAIHRMKEPTKQPVNQDCINTNQCTSYFVPYYFC
jgi:hypothetical protein